LTFSNQATDCKDAVPDGFPTDPTAGAKVKTDEESPVRAAARSTRKASGGEPRDIDGDALLFYASVDAREDGIYTTTSRSFAVVGLADTITEAETIAEDALREAGEEGLRVRHDIGKGDLVQKRIRHMKELRGE
jgi:phosphoribosylamine--glycine ligase